MRAHTADELESGDRKAACTGTNGRLGVRSRAMRDSLSYFPHLPTWDRPDKLPGLSRCGPCVRWCGLGMPSRSVHLSACHLVRRSGM